MYPWLSYGFGILIYLWWIWKKLSSKPTPETKSIVILGSKGAGKTTLWNGLQGKMNPTNYESTGEEEIKSFVFESDSGKEIMIQNTRDYGGDDIWVEYYENLIKEGTFIYYLIDLCRLEATKKEVRARIVKIEQIIKDKKYNNCGLKILATNLKKSNLNENEVPGKIKECLGFNSLKKKIQNIKIDDRIMPVELTNNDYIKKIRDEIAGV